MEVTFERRYTKGNLGNNIEFDVIIIRPDSRSRDTVEYNLSERPDKIQGFESLYEKFKQQYAPLSEDGYDLRLIGFLSPSERDICLREGIFTAEDFIAKGNVLKDFFVQRYPLLEKQIGEFLKNQGDKVELVAKISSLEAENADKEAVITDLKETIALLNLEINKLKEEKKAESKGVKQ